MSVVFSIAAILAAMLTMFATIVVSALLFAAAIGRLGGVLPAIRAARISIPDAIRGS